MVRTASKIVPLPQTRIWARALAPGHVHIHLSWKSDVNRGPIWAICNQDGCARACPGLYAKWQRELVAADRWPQP